MNVLHRLAWLSSVSALLLGSIFAFGQAPAPRIRGPIELRPSVPLAGSLNPHVGLSDDLGPLAPDTPIRGATLVFKRSAGQESDLQQLLAQQTDPGSPLYHHWLTPDEFAARFGVADADIAATETWLQSNGFTIDNLSRSHDRITFSGTATQIHQAFGAELHRLRIPTDTGTELHFAPVSQLSVPPALAPITAAVLHLSDFRPTPSVKPVPNYTTAGNQSHFLVPKDIDSMYDLWPLVSSSDTGTGQSLAITGQSFVKTGSGSSIYSFETGVSTSLSAITPVIVPGSGNEAIIPGDLAESEIDLEYSSGIAPAANIFFVYTGSNPNYNVFDALAYAITEDIAPVVSISYGGCEPVMSPADMQQANAVFQEAAAQGQTLVASSGDSGSTGCAPFSSSSGVSTTTQQSLAVSFPASSPYITAVGGTQMAPGTFAAGTSNYWDSPPGNGLDNVTSLISYVPEVVWNEDSSSFGIAASGGGPSSIFPRPAWQAGVPGIPSGSYRLVPDIALQASVSSPGYVICTDDPAIVGSLTDCSNGLKASNGTYILSGGTSFAAPIFAGFVTDLNQYVQATGLGNINPVLYSLAAQPAIYSSAFHDITSGTIACAIGDGNCGAPGTTGYAATTGYDMATGLGSLDFGKLAAAWPFTPPPRSIVPTYMYINDAPQTAPAGATIPVTVNLTISNGLCGNCTPPPPSGDLSILVDGAAITPVPLQAVNLGASATFNFVAPSANGSHVVVVRYPGDAYHLASYSTFAVLVGNVVPSGSFTLSANSLALAANSFGSTNVTITPAGGYSGALTWSASVTGGTVAQALCYLLQSAAVNGPTTITMSMGAGTACSSGPSGSLAPSPIQTPAQRSSLAHPSKPPSRRAPAAVTFVALLLCGALPARCRRKLLPLLSTAILAILATALTGCGGNSTTSTGGSNNTSPQPQVYTITLKATDSVNTAITASTSFTLTVN